MNRKHQLGIAGSIILFVGVFLPIISVPIMGNTNYFQNGKGDGTAVAVLAVISFFLVVAKRYTILWLTGLASLVVILTNLVSILSKISDAKQRMGSDLADNPFKDLADIATQSIQLQWGWAVLIVGAGMLIACAALKDEAKQL